MCFGKEKGRNKSSVNASLESESEAVSRRASYLPSNQRQPSNVFAYCCHEHWVQIHFQSGLWVDRGVAC